MSTRTTITCDTCGKEITDPADGVRLVIERQLGRPLEQLEQQDAHVACIAKAGAAAGTMAAGKLADAINGQPKGAPVTITLRLTGIAAKP